MANRGDLTIRPEDFWGWSIAASIPCCIYGAGRYAKDWCSGTELSSMLLESNPPEVHHIFPKVLLYNTASVWKSPNYNYSFLTKNAPVCFDKHPAEYLPVLMQKNLVIHSHWIPDNPELYTLGGIPILKDDGSCSQSMRRILTSLLVATPDSY